MGEFKKTVIKVFNLIDSSIEKLTSYMMGLLMLAVVIQVVYRFIIVKYTGKSFPYTDEFSRYVLIWISFIVIGIGLKEGTHVSLELLVKHLPAFWRKFIYVFNRFLILSFAVIVFIQGWGLMTLTKGFLTPTLQISTAWVYAAPTVGCFLVGIRALIQIFEIYASPNTSFLLKKSSMEKGDI